MKKSIFKRAAITLVAGSLMMTAIAPAYIANASHNNHRAVATTAFTADVQNHKISSDMNEIVNQLYQVKAGSTGSEARAEKAAESLEKFVYNHGAYVSYQSLEAAASDSLNALKEKDCQDIFERTSDALEVASRKAIEKHNNLETDVAFCQLMNALNNSLEGLRYYL